MTTITIGKLKTAETALAVLVEKGIQLDRVSVAMINQASFLQEEVSINLDFVPIRAPGHRFWHGNRTITSVYQIAREQNLRWSQSIEVAVMFVLEHPDQCQIDRTIVFAMKSMPFWKIQCPFTDEQRRSHRAYNRALSFMHNDRYVPHIGKDSQGTFLVGRGVEYVGESLDSWAFLKAA